MKFPVGGPRQPVYKFLRQHGFVMSDWSDKHWTRADGRELHLYGAGSMARVYNAEGRICLDGDLGGVVRACR